jgi:hypothetical protein
MRLLIEIWLSQQNTLFAGVEVDTLAFSALSAGVNVRECFRERRLRTGQPYDAGGLGLDVQEQRTWHDERNRFGRISKSVSRPSTSTRTRARNTFEPVRCWQLES